VTERIVPGLGIYASLRISVGRVRADRDDAVTVELRAYGDAEKDVLRGLGEGDEIEASGDFGVRTWQGRDGGWKQVVYVEVREVTRCG
jgi:hypothetical protein